MRKADFYGLSDFSKSLPLSAVLILLPD